MLAEKEKPWLVSLSLFLLALLGSLCSLYFPSPQAAAQLEKSIENELLERLKAVCGYHRQRVYKKDLKYSQVELSEQFFH